MPVSRRRDDDEEDVKPSSKPKGKGGGISLSDEDAIQTGLFASGPAHIKGSEFTNFKYGDQGVAAPVWLLTYTRGSKKEGTLETYEQPYSIGDGWGISRDGDLIAKKGQTGLPKGCNAIKYLVKPLRKALEEAGLSTDIGEDPHVLEGLDVEVERVEQEVRNITRPGARPQPVRQNADPKTILEIAAVTGGNEHFGDIEGGSKASSKAKSKAQADDDDEDETPAPKAKSKASSKAKDEDDSEDEGGASNADDVEDEAVEALVTLVENGPVKVGETLETKLEKLLKGNKQAAAIIDLATSEKFLKKQLGWSYDRKQIDAAD